MSRVTILIDDDQSALVEAMRQVYRQERESDLALSVGLSAVEPEALEFLAVKPAPAIHIEKRQRAAALSPKSQRKGWRP